MLSMMILGILTALRGVVVVAVVVTLAAMLTHAMRTDASNSSVPSRVTACLSLI